MDKQSSDQSEPFIGIPIQSQPYILLPYYRRRRRPTCCASFLSSSSLLALAFFILLLLSMVIFLLFPSHPHVSISRLSLRRLHVSSDLSLSVCLKLKVKIENKNFFSLAYKSLVVAIRYRGKKLGVVMSEGGRIRARGVTYVDAEMKLDSIRIVSDVFYFIEDLNRGVLPLETVTDVDGDLNLFFLEFPVDGRIICSVDVDTEKQRVIRQDCFPRVMLQLLKEELYLKLKYR